jgi:hypothetical protein
VQEYIDHINSVTVDNLNDVAVKYFNLDNYTLGIIRGSHHIQSIISTPPKPISTPKPKPKKPAVPPLTPPTPVPPPPVPVSPEVTP